MGSSIGQHKHGVWSETEGRCTDAAKHRWKNFPTQSPVCGGNDGIPKELDGITFSKWRKESIKAYGNAIVPQVVYPIYKAIQIYEDEN
jgi:predicted carbohydrate-binding protein with CBM5 and CBM33 domain